MPVRIAQTVQEKDRQERHRLPRWLLCQLCFATACPWLHSLPPCAPRMPRERHVGDEMERRHGVVTCRGKRLAVVDVLSRPGACCSPGLAGARDAPWRGPCHAVDGLPGKLLLPGSCASSGSPGKLLLPGPRSLRVAFPASSSCRGLGSNTLFLNGPRGHHGGSWRSPGRPCRGVLRLPVHNVGVLRYPYFSTPTGAPGPG